MIQRRAFVSQGEIEFALITEGLEAVNNARFFHPRQNTGQAGTQNTAFLCQKMKIERRGLSQYANDPPLLLRQLVCFQGRAKVAEDHFTGLQKGDK